ncbi:Gfo/Idh/MocA family protein [Paenibacillus sp. CF384]|uniref:Gfo/Idh/MocA family protein n=1 Tax=Paenibacillus sp. CF384 TaxID=1884382 RepID=UPI00089AFA30|nr:Gfo/Idh/MocA family oxidoreductase [Paenibacillus sp. CF384]SDX89588.1 Predicted dehydrogenase [Paenibacillus sp. CF384]
MKKMTASVVGGGAGGQLSMNALHNSEHYELVAIADIRPEVCEKLQKQYPGIRTYLDHNEMFNDCPTDVVCVSTFPPSHEEVALDALKLPLKGILVEKPLGHTVASGRRILEEIKKRDLPMAVPHGMVAKRTPLEIIRRVKGGDIGELKLVEIQNTNWDIINAGIHWLHFFVQLTGNEPMDNVMGICESSTRTYRDGMQVETTAVTYGQTKSGIRVVMNTGDHVRINTEGKDTVFRLIGTAGQIEFWGWENGYHILNAEFPKGELMIPEELAVTGHQAHLENMARRIEHGESDYSIPESSLLALEIVEGAYISSRHRCKVTFPVDTFEAPVEPDWNPGIAYSGTGGGRDGRKL